MTICHGNRSAGTRTEQGCDRPAACRPACPSFASRRTPAGERIAFPKASRLGASAALAALLLAGPALAQVGRTKERPAPARPSAAPKAPAKPATKPAAKPAPKPTAEPAPPPEPWTPAKALAPVPIPARALAWHPQGPLLAVAGTRAAGVLLHQLETGESIAESWSDLRGDVRGLAWDKEGSRLAAVGHDGGEPMAYVWSMGSGAPAKLRGHTDTVSSVSWHTNAGLLLTGSFDGTARVWHAESGDRVHVLAVRGGLVHGVDYHRGGLAIATASEDGVVRLWDPSKGSLAASLRGHAGAAYAVAFGGVEGRMLASGGEDGTVRLWDAAARKAVTSIRAHEGPARALAWSPNLTRLASGGDDGYVRVWTSDGHGVSEMACGSPVLSVAWSADGASLAASDAAGGIHVWSRVAGAREP